MTRVQAVVVRGEAVLMVEHRQAEQTYWCLPGGALEPGETPAEGAIRELREECNVTGVVVRQTSYLCYGPEDETYSFLVDIGNQHPALGFDPELPGDQAILSDVRWLQLHEIPERDRVFLWAAGLLGIGPFLAEIETWGDGISYPGVEEST